MFNILINNLSLVNFRSPELNTYYLNTPESQSFSEHERTFKGFYTNEPVTQVLLRKFSNEEKGEKLDMILSLTSEKVLTEKIRINNEEILAEVSKHLSCSPEEVSQLTHYTYYEKFVTNMFSNEHLIEGEELNAAKPLMEPIRIPDLPEASDIHSAVLKLSQQIIHLYANHPEGCRLFMDYTGGDRSTSTLLIALTKMLELRQIHVNNILAVVNFDAKTRRGEIRERIDVNYIFDFISGLNEFSNYGKCDLLDQYFQKSQSQNSIQLSPDAQKVLEKIHYVSDQIQLCRSSRIAPSIGELVNAIEHYIQHDTVHDPIFDYLIQDIKTNYASIYTGSQRTTINIIRWCLEKNLIQQAVTMYTELIPQELVKQRIVYYTNEDWIEGLEAKHRYSNFSDEYKFIDTYLWGVIGGPDYCGCEKITPANTRARCIIEYLQQTPPAGVKLKSGIKKAAFIHALSNYEQFKKLIRHTLNHAGSNTLNITKLRQNMYWNNKEDSIFLTSSHEQISYIGVQTLTQMIQELLNQLVELGMN